MCTHTLAACMLLPYCGLGVDMALRPRTHPCDLLVMVMVMVVMVMVVVMLVMLMMTMTTTMMMMMMMMQACTPTTRGRLALLGGLSCPLEEEARTVRDRLVSIGRQCLAAAAPAAVRLAAAVPAAAAAGTAAGRAAGCRSRRCSQPWPCCRCLCFRWLQ